MGYTIDKMTAADWDAVRAIYLEGIAARNATFETEAPSWDTWNNHHRPACRLVAKSNEQVLGRAVLSPVSRRPVYSGVAEVSVYMAADAGGSAWARHRFAPSSMHRKRPGSGHCKPAYSKKIPPASHCIRALDFGRSASRNERVPWTVSGETCCSWSAEAKP